MSASGVAVRPVPSRGFRVGEPGEPRRWIVRKRRLLRHEGTLDVADPTVARALRARRGRRQPALDPRATVEVIELPRVVGY